jgi:hypothetical protein
MNKWWHSIATVGLVIAGAVLPMAQTAISHHPVALTVLGGIWAVIGHLLPSPMPPR